MAEIRPKELKFPTESAEGIFKYVRFSSTKWMFN